MTMRQIVPDQSASTTSVVLPANLGGGVINLTRAGRVVVMHADTTIPSGSEGKYVSADGLIPQAYRALNSAEFFSVTAVDAGGLLMNATAYLYIDYKGNVGIQCYGHWLVGTVAYISA